MYASCTAVGQKHLSRFGMHIANPALHLPRGRSSLEAKGCKQVIAYYFLQRTGPEGCAGSFTVGPRLSQLSNAHPPRSITREGRNSTDDNHAEDHLHYVLGSFELAAAGSGDYLADHYPTRCR